MNLMPSEDATSARFFVSYILIGYTVHRSMAGGGHACAAVVVVRRRLLAMTQ